MKAENTTKIQFDSLSVNESYARGAAAAFLAHFLYFLKNHLYFLHSY